MTDDVRRRARRQARIATCRESEDRHRRAVAIPPTRTPTLDELLVGAQPIGGSSVEDARVWSKYRIDLPRPRDFREVRLLPEFRQICETIRQNLGGASTRDDTCRVGRPKGKDTESALL
ncbi:hypothetical protein [Methylobacterium sp. ID0610]|uniref:hypothetical protein n=1 Tax=Methylobacterium carpenticola TaxID=3344827 RepID=UPI0036977781